MAKDKILSEELWTKIYSLHNLTLAWSRVKENEGSPGVDRVTVAEFERNLEDNLSSLSAELEQGAFSPLPVLRTYIDKESGGQRPLGIPAVRDRIVQQALLLILSPVFNRRFLDCSYAYRPHRSALDAVKNIENLLTEGYKWVLDADIERFFDTINHDLLMGFLEETVPDLRIQALIMRFLKAGVFENMSIREEYTGITQGSALSPLLANIYLHRFDKHMIEGNFHLIRYADDFVILENSQERIGKAMAETAAALGKLKLSLSEKKTRLISVSAGFIFLGYYFDGKGKGPGKKSLEVIQQKLRDAGKANQRKNLDEKIEALKEIIRGWSNYFGGCRGIEPEDIFPLLAAMEISLETGDYETAGILFDKRGAFISDDPEIHYRLGHIAKSLGLKEESLDEFSRTLTLAPEHHQAKEETKQIELVDDDIYASIKRLRKLIHASPEMSQPYKDLAFCYGEVGEYGLAQEAYRKAQELEVQTAGEEPAPSILPSIATEPPPPLTYSDDDIRKFLSLFKGRTDAYASQWVDEKGRRGFKPITAALTDQVVKNHLSGEETLGLYLMDVNDRVSLAVIDIDIDQKALLGYAGDKEQLAKLYQLTHKDAVDIAAICDEIKIPVLIEDTGYKGRHVWFFFAAPLDAALARRFLKFLCERAGNAKSGTHREILPTLDRVKGKNFGPLVKLPLGVHKRTNRRCLFLDRPGNPLPDQIKSLREIGLIEQKQVENLLLTYAAKQSPAKNDAEESDLISRLLSGCKVIGYLANKARDTHYLDNAERVTLLYTLGFMGDEGNAFLHKVISNCINYDYEYTERQIRRKKSFPISCGRIKEKHESIALEVGCDCNLRLPRGGYPSPILHALQGKNAWPVSDRSLSLNTSAGPGNPESGNNITLCLRRYIELKRQLVGVEKSLSRIETEMSGIMTQMGKNCVETEFGMLERREHGLNTEWIIKL